MLVGDYEFGRSAEDISLLKMISQRRRRGARAVRRRRQPQDVQHGPLHRAAQAARPGQDFRAASNTRPGNRSASRKIRRYVALTMPRVLARLPYGQKFKRVDEFNFEEDVDGTDHDKYPWMNAAWAYAARITDAFAKYGWMARTRGVEGGGKVEGLAGPHLPDRRRRRGHEVPHGDRHLRPPRVRAVQPRLPAAAAQQGHATSPSSWATQSCQKPKTYFDPAANANAELSAKFNLMLCTSRFAHYLKVMARDKIGSFMETEDCERWLNDWIRNYCVDPNGASDALKARKPLSEARVEVREVKGKPGWYEAVAYLRPHFQLETLTTSMRLVAEVPKKA